MGRPACMHFTPPAHPKRHQRITPSVFAANFEMCIKNSLPCAQARTFSVYPRYWLCKSSSFLNMSNVFQNYLRKLVFIESWPISSGRHGVNHWEWIVTEKVHIKRTCATTLWADAYRYVSRQFKYTEVTKTSILTLTISFLCSIAVNGYKKVISPIIFFIALAQ